MKVAWLVDPGNCDGTLGGAELTMAEFAAAAPDGVEIVPDADGLRAADIVVVGNCVSYAADTIRGLIGKRVIRYFHDVDSHSHPDLRDWFLRHADCVFTSPLHRDRFPWETSKPNRLIPPPIDLDRFRDAAEGAQERSGAVSVAAWGNPGKSPHRAAEWAAGNGGIDFYGTGPYAPDGTPAVAYDDMPALLAAYETFVFLPDALEPFGRLVVEAFAAGCRVVTNRNVGARYWIEEEPEKLESAAEDFWSLVTA